MTLDPRLNAFRPDLADARLRGQVEAARFVEGRPMQLVAPISALRREARADAMQLTQALLGETVMAFQETDGFAFVQLDRDRYVGYVASAALSRRIDPPTHRVAVPTTYIYPLASLKTQPATAVSLGAAVAVTGWEGSYAAISTGGFIYAAHLQPMAAAAEDFVSVAERLLHAPYYWGGKSASGIDCSGLVQLSLEVSGCSAPRDTDMQERELGQHLRINDMDGLRRGDLVFWKGHVGIMQGPDRLLHANGYHMQVVSEPLREAVARITATESPVTSLKRL
jgi:cell wall-associated NlpC family hydrolase